MNKKLGQNFYARNTLKVARGLLGKYLIRKVGSKKIEGKIVETEAYMGLDDLASHASRGKTPRTKIMFGLPGVAYIYLIYGMYYCFNIVTEKDNFPAAVLIRAVEPVLRSSSFAGQTKLRNKNNLSVVALAKTDGPGKLSRYFKINKSLNGENLVKSEKLWLEDKGEKIKTSQIISKKRIGVDYAKHCAEYPWRFYIKNSPHISKK